MASVHQQSALNNIAKLMETPKYSDLILECQGRQWPVHKAIICSASKVLAGECDNPMREGQSGVMKHDEFGKDTVQRMISYIYKQTYEVEGEDQLTVFPRDNNERAAVGNETPSTPMKYLKRTSTSTALENTTISTISRSSLWRGLRKPQSVDCKLKVSLT